MKFPKLDTARVLTEEEMSIFKGGACRRCDQGCKSSCSSSCSASCSQSDKNNNQGNGNSGTVGIIDDGDFDF